MKRSSAGKKYGNDFKIVGLAGLGMVAMLLSGTYASATPFGNFPIGNRIEQVRDITVSGRVTGEGGAALRGASISVKGKSGGTSTNASGAYSISVPDNAVLIVSYVGYESQEVSVSGRNVIDISLKPSAITGDAVVVVGYGTQRKVDVTGSVASVKGEEISKQASINPISALQGKVSGVQIVNNGAPGSSPEIKIRGVGSIYGGATPLYVVDGVWFNDISFLSPQDIENISILKDASSQSIYGVRAANGVILVTTKKGKKNGKATLNYNGYAGWQTVTNEVKMANGTEYANSINELYTYTGFTPLSSLNNSASFAKGTNWNHQVLRSALVTSHNVSLQGGTDKSSYTFSLGYLNQDGIVEGNNYTRYTALLQNDFQPMNKIRLGYTITGAASNSKDINGGIFHQIYSASPVVPVYYADGSYGDPKDFDLGDGANFNPQATLDFFDQESRNYRVTGNVFGEVKLPLNLTFKTSLGGEFGQAQVHNYNPVYTATQAQRNLISMLTVTRGETRNWIFENTLTFSKKFGDHMITALAGQSAQENSFYGLVASAQNVPSTRKGDRYLKLGDITTVKVVDNGSLSTSQSYFGRVNYSFKNRYLINASLRRDGSSSFVGDKRWGTFPSVGAGWVVSQENFMADQKIFTNLKLKGSWGQVGNSLVPINAAVLTTTGFPPAVFGSGTGTTATSQSVASLVPPTLYWEKSEGTDIGLEAGLLKNRLTIEADYYTRTTKDAIFAVPVLATLGTVSQSIIANQADIRNRGFEFSANYNDIISKKVTFSVGGNISFNENKVTRVTSGKNPIYAGGAGITGGSLATRTVVGDPIGMFYGYQVEGVYQTAAEASAGGVAGAKAGDFKYKDQNGDGKIDLTNDRVVLGNPNPKITYGINTSWAYMNWDLAVDFQGVAKVDVYNANLGYRFGNENFTKEFYDNRWHGAGTSNTYPSTRIGGGSNYLPNSFFVESGSYFRVRNMQLGYTLPSAWSNKIKSSKVRVYANAQNAFNFFKYRGFSPEVGGGATNAGLDINVYPLYATYNFGVNVTF